jgi:hypothetical protein
MEFHHVHLTDIQKRKLLNGHGIQLKAEHLNGSHKVVLDKKQSTKIKKALREGKGARIHFNSEELIKNNVMHGSGFHSLLSKAKQALYSVPNQPRRIAARQVQHASNVVESNTGMGVGKTERFFKNAGKAIVGAAKSKTGKAILKGITKVAVPAILAGVSAETGVPVVALSPAITGAINNGIDGMGIHNVYRKAPAKRRGKGLYPSGY